MSCYEWEAGTIKLPANEVLNVRNKVRKAAEDYKARLYELTQKFWKECPPSYRRNDDKYRLAVAAFLYGNKRDSHGWAPDQRLPDGKLPSWLGFKNDDYSRGGFVNDLDNLLLYTATGKRVQNPRGWYERVKTPPRRILKTDVDELIGKPTGAKFALRLGEGELRFDGRIVVWAVDENNHAREHGRSHEVARVFFGALDRVTWTRGSGGEIVGNDEYNRDDREAGGGGNYVLDSYRPGRKRVPAYRW